MTVNEAIGWAKRVAQIDPVKGLDQRCMDALAAEVERLRGELALASKHVGGWARRSGIADAEVDRLRGMSAWAACEQCTQAAVERVIELSRDNKNLIESRERQAELYIKSAQRGDMFREALERIREYPQLPGAITLISEALK